MELTISLIIAIIGCAISVYSFFRNKDKDSKEEGSLLADIKYIQRGIDDIRLDNKEMGRKLNDHNDRLIKVEESCKSAHHRIDELKILGVKNNEWNII